MRKQKEVTVRSVSDYRLTGRRAATLAPSDRSCCGTLREPGATEGSR
jgi:hypothetical protein